MAVCHALSVHVVTVTIPAGAPDPVSPERISLHRSSVAQDTELRDRAGWLSLESNQVFGCV